jgi:hypothetical protein
MNNVLVKDNALPEQLANSFNQNIYRLNYIISQDILPNQMDKPSIVKDDNTFNTIQMVHRVFNHNDQRPQVNPAYEPIKYALNMMVEGFGYKVDKILRLKFNLIQPHPKNKEGNYNTAHIDDEEMARHFVLLYYPMESDGDTVLFNELFDPDKPEKPKKLTIHKRIEPKANRCVMFKGNRFHASSSPIKNDMRIALNCNFSLLENYNEKDRDTRKDPFKGTSIEGKD